MKIVTVALREQRISPKKARLCIDLVRGKNGQLALEVLTNTNKKSARLVLKLLKSALDACRAKDYKPTDVFISEAVCQEGRRLNRFLTSARGRSRSIKHRMAHLKISLSKVEEQKGKEEKSEGKKTVVKKEKRGKNGTES